MPEASPLRILVIEDNPIDRQLFGLLLRTHAGPPRFESVEVEEGRAGLEQFRRVHPACVLLDLNLPDVEGLDLLRSIAAEPNACPVIVMTAYGSQQVAVDAMKAGAADYLVKGSITPEGLVHVIENALEKRALQREIEAQRAAIEERNRQLESALQGERAARAAVEQSESRYRTLAEAMPQLVWTADHPSGDWDYVNERWTRLTGAPPWSALGRGWLEFLDSDDRARVTDAWLSAVTRVAALELECRIRAKGGGTRLQLMRALPLVQDGHPLKWLGTFTDIDDQRRTERLLHERQKLESIGILAGGVAHDFNNLLVGIVGGMSYALDTLPEDHALRPILEGALKSGEWAAHLTRQLLAYAGKGKFQVQDVDLAKSVSSTWELIHGSLPRSIELRVQIPEGIPPIRTDPSQLQQILMNLIFNASEAMPADRHGVVTVRAVRERVDATRSTASGDLDRGDYVRIEVTDNGSGMDAELLGRIFEPFFTTKFTGRGLGLAAVHGIVRSNRGLIEATSTVGEGTTFRVLLPAAAVAEAEAAAPVETAAQSAGKRILVIDDEAIVRNVAQAILERAGHEVEAVASGEEAIARLAVKPAFSLVLLDLNMPGLDGKDTFTAIRRMQPDLPVVVCSGYNDSEVRNRLQFDAVNGFLQKPFQYKTLVGKVAEVLEGVKT